MQKDLLNKLIEQTYGFSKISIFVHTNPDCDALGSAFALARILKLNTFGTRVKIVGINTLNPNDFKNFFTFDKNEVEDEFIEGSLAFIVDTANQERVLSQKHTLAKKTILVDHHVKTVSYTDLTYINDQSIATCEMLAYSLMHTNLNFDVETLNYLLLGLTTDSNRLMYDKVSDITYEIMAWFFKNNVKHYQIYQQLYERNLDDILFDNELIKTIKTHKQIAYLNIDKSWNQKYNFTRWGDKVYLLSNIKNYPIWFVVYFDETANTYKVSLRSNKYKVRLVANQFNGGGHDLAAGCSLANIDQLNDLLKALELLIKNQEVVD
ncbi:bifunctional oligoribonuclease/PAP phosphatase NrnA [Ureaplasma urealyticum]|uniref:DHH family phosphoesterase n=1 Tax=Ureaplasma urealyticum TaxID=2130 RepID=UPI00290F9677|nr:bifunctional oligoribonuclease/PAP phosphatase NrnA [Ureaplasma urealyticum]MDU3864880.1 bifunctional oligoribonuclease/PAP phosphatase NrnA [Ureaplasma urealyticum]